MPLHDALFVETNPGAGEVRRCRGSASCSPECRLPLAPITEATRKAVDEAMVSAGLLQSKAAE